MDMGNNSVEVGDADDGAETEASQGTVICFTINGDQITMEQYAPGGQPSGNGQPVDATDAMKALLDAIETNEGPDGDEASFQAGLGSKGASSGASNGSTDSMSGYGS